MLSDYMVDEYDKEAFFIEKEDWYSENNVEIKLSENVISIDEVDKFVITSNGKYYYDKLILANGSSNFIPHITDINLEGVFTIRNLKDVKNVLEYSKDVKNVVMLGGGLLGLEIAYSLIKLGKKVTVVEISEGLARRQLDEKLSKYLLNNIEKMGVRVLTSMPTNAILGNDRVTGVHLCDSEVIDAEMVIVSAGIRPNIGIVKETSLDMNRGIKVDERMQTSVKDIYAAGDVAEFDNRVYGIWPASILQGEVAGANAVGDDKKFEHFTPSTVFDAFGIEFFSIGDIGKEGNKEYSFKITDDIMNGIYKKYTYKNGVLVGGILFGDLSDTLDLIRGIGKKED